MKGSKLKMYKRFELRMFWVHLDSVGPKVLHVLCHCYAAINIFIKIFDVFIIYSYNAIGIKLALKEQQSTLDSVVASAVRDAVDSVLIPALRDLRADIQATNNSVKELRAELEALASAAKQTCDRVDSVQAAAHEDRRTVMDLRNQLEQLTRR